MKRLAADYKEELVKSGTTLLNLFETNPPVHEWARRDTGTITEAEEPDDQPQHGGGSSFQRGLLTLGQWDMADRINAFHESIRIATHIHCGRLILEILTTLTRQTTTPIFPLVPHLTTIWHTQAPLLRGITARSCPRMAQTTTW
ncbi:hypothetical protein RSAG8_11243, partial [Rhizoctonia solani AG-8 WAC10335]